MDYTAKNGSCRTRAKDHGKNPLDTKNLRCNETGSRNFQNNRPNCDM